MKFFRLMIAAGLLLAAGGCVVTQGSPDGSGDNPYTDTRQESGATSNPAVVTLKQEADRQLSSGNLQLAANALERAIRISPRDASLRQQLAAVRLQQGNPVQAKSLARMAVVYGQGQPAVQAAAWETIARAEAGMGNRVEAEAALENARRLRDDP